MLQTTVPTAFRPAGLFYQLSSGPSPTRYTGYVPVSGDSPSPDPLRQAVDRAQVPVLGGSPDDPLRQAVDRAASLHTNRAPGSIPTSDAGAAIGALIGGLMGGALGGGIVSPFTGVIGTTIGGAVGRYAPGAISGPAGRSLGEATRAGATPGGL